MIYNLISWLFGIFGIAVNFIIYHKKTRKELLKTKLLSDIIWCIHYMPIGAWSGAAVCCISMFRETVFLNSDKKWAKSKLWLLGFVILNAVSVFFTWKGIFSILPACASTLSIFSFWVGNPKLTRTLQLPISTAFLIYNSFSHSYMGILNEIITLISIFSAFFMTYKERKTENA